MANLLVNPEKLKVCCTALFEKAGVPKDEAEIISDSLLEADLTGVESHGTSRVGIYIKRIEAGAVERSCKLNILNESTATMMIDACNSNGIVSSERVMRMGIEKAKEVGCVTIAVRNGNHFGAAGYFTKMAAKENMIAFCCTNGPSVMAPWGSYVKYQGTNPFSLAMPMDDQPVVLDMATSVVARGKIVLSDRKGETVPDGWGITAEGKPTNNAREVLDGTVLPFGGVKGYCIALAIDALSGILTGANYGSHINEFWDIENPQGVGHFFVIIDISRFVPVEEFKTNMMNMRDEIKALPRIEGVNEIFIPGEPEFNNRKERSSVGFMMSEVVYKEIQGLCNHYQVDFNIE